MSDPIYLLKASGTVVQAVAADTSIGLRWTPQVSQSLKLISFILGADNYGAARTINLAKVKETSFTDLIVYDSISVDNEITQGPRQTVAASTVIIDTVAAIGQPLGDRINKGEVLQLEGVSLASTEPITYEISIEIRGSLFHGLPTEDIFGTNVTQGGASTLRIVG